MSETLSEILERCRRGDEDAVSILVGRFRSWALDLAYALVNDRSLAEDVVQEAFIAALQGLDGLRNADAFPGWLHQILRRQAFRIGRKHRSTIPQDMESTPAATPSLENQIERNELRRIVRDALDRLPTAERDAAVRFYIERQRCLDIAQALSIPPGTVRRRLFDARTRLRDMLLGYIDAPPEERDKESNSRELPS